MSFIYLFLPKGGLKFHLFESEKIFATCHAQLLNHKDDRDKDDGDKDDGDKDDGDKDDGDKDDGDKDDGDIDDGDIDDGDICFVRMTNKRIVFSCIEYPLMPLWIAMLVDWISRPSDVDIEFVREDILDVIDDKKGMFSSPKCIILTQNKKYCLCGRGVKKIYRWWASK